MTSPTTSPTVQSAIVMAGQMSFFDALREVMGGRQVTKIEWRNPEIYLIMDEERLKIKLEDGLLHPLIVSLGDMLGSDWIII